jgi:hypothetical protein
LRPSALGAAGKRGLPFASTIDKGLSKHTWNTLRRLLPEPDDAGAASRAEQLLAASRAARAGLKCSQQPYRSTRWMTTKPAMQVDDPTIVRSLSPQERSGTSRAWLSHQESNNDIGVRLLLPAAASRAVKSIVPELL